jgi:Ni/Co efflux regulator RcnB
MKKLLAALIAATFAFAGAAIAQDKKTTETKKPTADECKKDPKMKGCEEKKDAKK